MKNVTSIMPLSRQVRSSNFCREKWKKRALDNQKKVRFFSQKTVELDKSRNQWKAEALESRKEINRLKREIENLQKKKVEEAIPTREPNLSVKKHHYISQTIQASVEQVIEGGNSYRGVATTLEILSRSHLTESPNYNSIRSWVGRIGLYEISRKKEKREDWIFLIDFTLELGNEKVMVIYGISEESWQKTVLAQKRALKHTDGEIIAIEVTESATGEWVQKSLKKLTETVGIPRQIITDKGSNLKKGIELYQEDNQEVIFTYDVTHAMANFLKKELASSAIYQDFLRDCSQCKQQLKQTELAFLAPPSQRSQCRYFNAEKLVDWAKKLLDCPLDVLSNVLKNSDSNQTEERFKEKFFWLGKYLEIIPLWGTMIQMTRLLEKQLKVLGLNQDSLTRFLENLSPLKIPPSLDSFKEKIIHYLKIEIEKIKDDRTMLATTDVLESIFGKYKRFSSRCPLKEFRQMLLTIPLCTINLTSELIQEALSTVSCHHLSEWLNDVFGLSMLSQRKTVFNASFDDMKVA